MDKNLDLRSSKTNKMIKEAFFELMDTIGFENISVVNLTKKALISRTTFYLHYKDKYDLLEQIENEILDGFKNIANNLCIDDIVKKGLNNKNTFLLLVKIYEYVKENQQFFKLIMCNNENPSFYYRLSDAIKVARSEERRVG